MKVGDLVRGAYDKNMYRIGIITRIATILDDPYNYGTKWGPVASVLWTTTPMGLGQTGAAWVKDLEKL